MEAAAGTAEVRQDSSSPPPWQLTDLISVDELQSIQDTFARAFGLPTVIVDTHGVNATAITHRVTFCEDLTRTSPVAGPRCTECDLCGMREAAGKSAPAIFKCWNGLYDCAIPIAPKGHVLGYFLCGQILTESPDPAAYASTAAEIGVAPEEYVEALARVTVVPYEQYKASVDSMHVLAEMIAEQAAASIDSLQMLEQARRAEEGTAQLVEELDTILGALRDIGSQPDYQATLDSIADNLARLIPWDSCVIYLAEDEGEELVPVVVRDPFPDKVAAYRPRKGRGILGAAVLGGVGRRYLDITRESDFEAIPGVPVEPESALVMPMVYKGTVSGVICLSRFERRTFTDHDLRVLDVFSSQASVSIQVSKLASDNAQRLREERAFGRLRLAMAPRTKLESILAEAGQVGVDLLAAEAAVLSAPALPAPAVTVTVGIDEQDGASLLRALEPAIRRAIERDDLELASHGSQSVLVMPLNDGEPGAFALFSGRDGMSWDRRLAEALAVQVSLGIEKAGMQERERRLLLQYQRLSELGTELVSAHDAMEVRSRLLARTPEILSADVCFIALLDQGPDAITVELGPRRSEERRIKLEGGARLASVRLRDEAAPDRSVFDTWSESVLAAVESARDLATWLAEPLPVSSGALGGLFVGWRSPETPPSAEQRRILRVLAGSAGTALARFAASMATDSTLGDRLLELEALTGLGQRISGLTREAPIVDELLSSLRRVGKLDGAIYGAFSESGPQILCASGLADGVLSEVNAVLQGLEPISGAVRRDLGDNGSEVIVIPVADGAERRTFLAGVGPRIEDHQRDRVMAALARYGSVALENAHLHDRQREAIERLERQHVQTADQYTTLERILSVHETLAVVVLEGRGLASVVRSLGTFLDADMLVIAPQDRVLAGWPADETIEWRPQIAPGTQARTVVTATQDAHVVAAPAVVDGDAIAWIIARMTEPPGDVERAAVEYGALLVALELLRERTAIEVETRLRGGLLEELFSGLGVEDLVVKRALAFGYDLERPSRVFLVEAAADDSTGPRATLDVESFFAPVADCAARWSSQNLVALRGGAVVVVVPEEPDEWGAAGRAQFEDELSATALAKMPKASTAVGTLCEAVEDYRHSYLAARRGLDLVSLLGHPGDVFSFRVSNLESMLLQSTRPDVIVKFISRYVEPLDHYDREHTSDLRRTLEVYYEAGSTLEEAARRLHVHVSTLRYRLKKAAQLLDVDLKDGSASLDIQVALKAARVLAVHRG